MGNDKIRPGLRIADTEAEMSRIEIIHGDCLKVLPTLPKATMIFADPPDNLGIKYKGYTDHMPEDDYFRWIDKWLVWAMWSAPIVWLSYYYIHQEKIWEIVKYKPSDRKARQIIWHFTFGQNSQKDFVPSYRPILRFMQKGAATYPDAVRVPSARQIKYNDKRANPKGKMPDDIWEFRRVCGTFKERKKWHPCQHPKDLLKRMVLFSTRPSDLVIDLFAGSGNMLDVCKELDRDCIGIEISEFYCEKIAEYTGAKLKQY